jgi:Zn-dependent protease with chaperone function
VPLVGNAFHAETFSGDCIPTTLSPVLDSEIFVEMIGIPNIAKINELQLTIGRTSNKNNAFATFYKGGRMLIIDPVWARSGADAYLIIGHEAGHHFCGHTLPGFQGRPKEKELEADRFSGASIKRFEVYHGKAFLAEAIRAAARLYSEQGSRTHPPRAARIEAITQGYNSGSPCGNLAPAIRGFSPSFR